MRIFIRFKNLSLTKSNLILYLYIGSHDWKDDLFSQIYMGQILLYFFLNDKIKWYKTTTFETKTFMIR